ncbi:hypothetical protein CLU79DRAFT_736974 [Phycomyces nitens]|nr:hypothetical protein CLU79DRAFT_736974 [Phycomyces nitens]
MAIVFLVYLGYLIRQIAMDIPLLRISTETLPNSYPAPDIEICAQNTTVRIVRCDITHADWSVKPLDNCYDKIRIGSTQLMGSSFCNLFEANGTLNYVINDPNPTNDLIRRIDIYWRVDNVVNATAASLSVPALSIQLYSPSFNRWTVDQSKLIPQQIQPFNDMVLGAYRATSYINATSALFFAPSKYRAIMPNDPASLVGFDPKYKDIITLATNQNTWPLHANPFIANNTYQGFFTVQPSHASMEVRTEQRQHTALAGIALAGGAYGVLTTIYILFFGMTRLTPWGLVHHIPVMMSRGKEHIRRKSHPDDQDLYETNDDNKNMKSRLPWFLRKHLFKDLASSDAQSLRDIELKSSSKHIENVDHNTSNNDNDSEHFLLDRPLSESYERDIGAFSMKDSVVIPIGDNKFQELSEYWEKRAQELDYRVEELEMILREYFLNTEYLDQIRQKSRSTSNDPKNRGSTGFFGKTQKTGRGSIPGPELRAFHRPTDNSEEIAEWTASGIAPVRTQTPLSLNQKNQD